MATVMQRQQKSKHGGSRRCHPILKPNYRATCGICQQLKTKGEAFSLPRSQTFPVGEPAPVGMQLRDGTDLRQVTVLSKDDWARIQKQLNRRQEQEAMIQKIHEARESQRQTSKDIVATWGNTIAGIRQKKMEARKIREKKEEEERIALDIEEAKVQAQERKDFIEKAKTLQYYQTDRVKRFHGALQLTEVLKERDAQLELKKLRDAAVRNQEEQYLAELNKANELGAARDQDKARERQEAARDGQRCLLAQISERDARHKKQKELAEKEGKQLRQLAVDDYAEQLRMDELRKEERRQTQLQNMTQIQDVRRMRQLEKQMEEEEDDECRIFAAAKRQMLKMRAEKEKSMRDEKLERLDRIRNKLAAQMKKKADDEDERIRRAVAEKEAKRQQEEKEKEELILKRIAEATAHRMQQIKNADERKQEERLKELEALRVRREADELYRRHEAERQNKRKQDALDLAQFHHQQTDERLAKEETEFKESLALAKANQELLEMEEKQFQEYAQRVIQHAEEGGRNTYPLRKVAQPGPGGGSGPVFVGKGGVRPSYMSTDQDGVRVPHFRKDSTEETKVKIQGRAPTKKRLGFVW